MKRYLLVALLFIIMCMNTASAVEAYAARVNNEVISIENFNTAFDAAKKQLQGRERIDFQSEEGATLLAATRRSILDEMIDLVLLGQGAQQLAVTVSPQEIEDRIKKVQKEFPSKSVFSDALNEDGISQDDLRHGIRQEILIEKISDKLAGNLKVNESEIETFFNKNKELFAQPKRVQLFQILVTNEKDAHMVIDKFKKGTAWKELAGKYSLDQFTKAQGGEIGFVEESQLPPYAATVVPQMKTGDISQPVKAEEGFYVLYCGEVLGQKEMNVDASRDQIRNFLVQEKKRSNYERWFEHFKDKATIEINNELFFTDTHKPTNDKPPLKDPRQPGTPKDPQQIPAKPIG